MSLVGIIANPVSGKDIRRVVSQAIIVNNQQKVNIVSRLLTSMTALGVRHIEIMPDPYGIGERALEEVSHQAEAVKAASIIDMPVFGREEDTERAAAYLEESGAKCIIILGGDGTIRVAAKASGDVPLLPISTGTNNVVPYFIEGTVAGLAAGYLLQQQEAQRRQVCYRHKRLLVFVNGQVVDQALVDVALVADPFSGSQAVWQPETIRQVFVTRAHPMSIGISSAIGVLQPIGRDDLFGATVQVGPGGTMIHAMLVPGNLLPLRVGEVTRVAPGGRHAVLDERPAMLALDGERKVTLRPSDRAEIMLDLEGPWIVDCEKVLLRAVSEGAFRNGWYRHGNFVDER